MEAASALGDIAELAPPSPSDVNAEMPAIACSALVRYYRERCFDADTGSHLPLDFRDIGEYYVVLAVIAAMARARTDAGVSPDGVLDGLVKALAVVDNRSPEFDSTGALISCS